MPSVEHSFDAFPRGTRRPDPRGAPNGKHSAANAASTSSGSCLTPTEWPAIPRLARSPGRQAYAHELPADPHIGRVGGQMRAWLVPVELAGQQVGCRVVVRPGRTRPVPGPRIRACHALGLHDPADAAARHDDTPASQLGPDLPGPVHPAAVPPHALHVTLMGIDAFGLGMPEHPVAGRLDDARDPAPR